MTWTGIRNFLRNWDLHLEFATGTLVFFVAVLAIFGLTTQSVILASIGWSAGGVSAVMVREHRERRGLLRRNKVFPDEYKAFDQLVQFVETRSGKLVFRNDPVTIAGKDRPALLAWNGTEDFEILRDMIESLAASYREDPGVEGVQM